MDAIVINALSKSYKDVKAVDGLSFSVKEGELVSLLGVNGAGKTTTVKMLCCLSRPDSGEAFICGKSILSDSHEVKKTIAVSPQETAVAPGLSVKENLELIGSIHALGKNEISERVSRLGERLSLNAVMSKRAGKLSGGWQRRLSIAMALITHPRVLFLDEPTLGLDVLARRELWELISTLKSKMTVILTTHYMEEAEALSDRVAIMDKGRLITMAGVDEIKRAANTDSFEEAFIRTVKGATL